MRTKFLTRIAFALALPALTATLSNAAKVFDEVGGVVVAEAENFSAREQDPVTSWLIIPTEDPGPNPFANARGGQYIQALPSTGVNNNNTSVWANKPWVDYLVNINTAGLYRMYLRWNGYTTDNSMYGEIVEMKDGPGGSIPDWYRWGIADTVTPFDDFDRGWDGSAGLELVSGDSGDVPATWNLTPGTYTVRLHFREDGAAADAFALQLNSLPAPGNPGPAQSGLATSYVRIITPPANATATTGGTATFTVTAEGTGTLTYQWQSKAPGATTFANIAGATSASFTTPAATDAMNNTQYQVLVSNGTRTAISAPATLITDSSAPSLQQVTGGASGTSVALRYNERLDKTSAETAANYSISGGLAVTKATLDPAGQVVYLTTAQQTANTSYTVTATGVKDAAGNASAALTGTFTGATVLPGKLLVRLYRGIAGTAVTELLNNPKYPNAPDEVLLWDVFSSGENTGDVFGENYGGEVTGFVTPTTTGDYKFYIRSDDASRLELSTDETPAGLRTIAAQGGCCNAFTDAPGSLSSQPIRLEAGKKYYVRAIWKEGGGGDWLQVGWLGPNDADINDAASVVPIPAEFLSTGFSKTATLNITQQPANVSTAANSPATFTLGFNANSVFGTNATVQWQRAPAGSATFTDIAGGTGPTFTVPFPTAGDSGAQFRAVASINITDPELGTSVTATSQPATLTVTGDTTPPTVSSVIGGVNKVAVIFNEPLDAASAAAAANYTIAGGTVSAAQVISAAGQAGIVELTVTGLTPGNTYNVAVSGVKDVAGNTMTATTRPFEAYHILSTYDTGAAPPGTILAGSANIKPSGSHNGSGFLELTPAVGSQQGSIVYPDVLNGGEVQRFTALFKVFVGQGSGNPADGYSFNLASDLPADPAAPASFGEEGVGSGLTVAFDTYDNGNAEAPAFSLKWQGTEFASKVVPKATLVNNKWTDVVISVNAAGNITVQHDNVKHFDNEPIPGWAPIAGAMVGLGGRTGGELETHWVDDLKVVFNADVTLPQPPTISITAPTQGQVFVANSPVTITVNAADPEGQITRVEFFANGNRLGESTTAPYSFTVPSAPAGMYVVTARITDAQGIAVTSSPITVKSVTPNAQKILYVHGNAGPNSSDLELMNYLLGQGFDTVSIGAAAATTADADGKVLVITSSTVTSGDVAEKFLNVTVPVVNWENALQDNYLFALDQDGTTRGATGGQTAVEIVTPSHPIAGGLSGTVTIANAPGVELTWATPAASAIPIAQIAGTAGRLAIYAFEPGAVLIDGATRAAGRRVHVGGGDLTYAGMNAAGKQLWHNAINWAIGSVQPPARPTASISRTGGNVTITSSDGGTVQATPSLSGTPVWTDVGPAPQSVPTSGTMRFFRIRK
jgi:hypothetical protein